MGLFVAPLMLWKREEEVNRLRAWTVAGCGRAVAVVVVCAHSRTYLSTGNKLTHTTHVGRP